MYGRLSRWPDVEAENLVAVDAADRLLVDAVLAALSEESVLPRIVVLGERYGAMALGLASQLEDTGGPVLVVTDSQVHRNAVFQNAAREGLAERVAFEELDGLAAALSGEPFIAVGAVPRAHAVADEWADAVARLPGCRALVLGGMVKHLSPGLNAVLESSFEEVAGSRARQKARLVWCTGPRDGRAERCFEERTVHTLDRGLRLTAVGVPGAFGASRIDPGTRLLLPLLRDELAASTPPRIVDLGCGNGTISAYAKLVDPEVSVTATDVSHAAIRSTRLTAAANGVEVTTMADDALSSWLDASEDFIVLNPPFHLGNTVTEDIAVKLFEAAARVLRPGGTLLAVWNQPLAYSGRLRRIVGPTERIGGNRKFQVTRSIRG